jgi:HEAT repeat protein
MNPKLDVKVVGRTRRVEARIAGTNGLMRGRRLLDDIRTDNALRKKQSALCISELYCTFRKLEEATRFYVTNALAAVNNQAGRNLLVKVLNADPSPLVRHEAAFALGCVGNRTVISALKTAFRKDRSFLVRHEAAMAISEVGSKREIAVLRRGLRDKSNEVVVSCRVAIQRIRERTAALTTDRRFPPLEQG